MSDATERDRPDSDSPVRLESERKVVPESRGSPPRNPGRAGKGRSEHDTAPSRARAGGDFRQARAAEVAAAQARSEQRFAESMRTAAALFPEIDGGGLPGRDWLPVLALGVGRLRRIGEEINRESLIDYTRSQGYEVSELEGEDES